MEKKKILPKLKGSSMMISGFICPCHGFMSADLNRQVVRSYKVFLCVTNRDGWFTKADLVKQLDECAESFSHLHKDMSIYIFFKNSMTHRARAPDALDATRLNLSDGGVNAAKQRDGCSTQSSIHALLSHWN
jgi:hypothetical protein